MGFITIELFGPALLPRPGFESKALCVLGYCALDLVRSAIRKIGIDLHSHLDLTLGIRREVVDHFFYHLRDTS